MAANGRFSLFATLFRLEELENLKLLNDDVAFKLRDLPLENLFPRKLTRLTLLNTSLDWRKMSTLGKLENLEVSKWDRVHINTLSSSPFCSLVEFEWVKKVVDEVCCSHMKNEKGMMGEASLRREWRAVVGEICSADDSRQLLRVRSYLDV
ncbi:hypothetical protein ACH5RR_036281 [Cinchona calisaya]|uniref:Uncharacterized protein n=1 Tax=Cinchona calisaya TaxID=153742 RepID=A0ABD2Y5Y4_9GENT